MKGTIRLHARRSVFCCVAFAGVLAACSGGTGRTVPPTATQSSAHAFTVPASLPLAVPPKPPAFTPAPPNAARRSASAASTAAATHAAFFAGEVPLSNNVFYLELPNKNVFGYYSYLGDPHYIYHFDMGYEYVVDADATSGGVYLYDFASSHWWYTGRSYPFPYVYDFDLGTILYYYPDTASVGHYTTAPRYFYNFSAGQVITLPASATPTPTATPSPITFSQDAMYVSGTDAACPAGIRYPKCNGPSQPSLVTVSQANGFVGPFTVATDDAAIATATYNGSREIGVTPHKAGITRLTVTGYGGATASIPVYVTTISTATVQFTGFSSARSYRYTAASTCLTSAVTPVALPSPMPSSYTDTLYNQPATGFVVNNGHATPLPIACVNITVSDGTVDMANQNFPVTVTPGRDNPLTFQLTATAPTPAPVSFSEDALYLSAVDAPCPAGLTYPKCGPAPPYTVYVNQANGFAGPFTVSTDDASIATAVYGNHDIAVTAHRAGVTRLNAAGYGGATASIPLTVTTISAVTVQFTGLTTARSYRFTESAPCFGSGGAAVTLPSPMPSSLTETFYNQNTTSVTVTNGHTVPCTVSNFNVSVSDGTVIIANKDFPVSVTLGHDNTFALQVP